MSPPETPPRAEPRSAYRRLVAPVGRLALTVVLGACAGGYVAVPATSPERIPELERRVARSPDDVPTLTELGSAYRQAERPEDAVRVLEHARAVAPDEPLPVVILGLAHEDLERYGEARALYEEYLELMPDSRIRDMLESRIELMRRREFEVLVARALASEASLDAEPAPARVAVFPFLFDGDDPGLDPLGYAMGGMVATDLAQVDRLTLLERLHLEELMREIELGESDLVDPATAARSGRLLGAGRIVQGRLGGGEQQIELDAAAVRVRATEPDISPVSEQDPLERIFDMEKSLVLGLIDAMGITLTAAERERVLQRRTESLQALLAYGRGLQASAREAYEEAESFFEEAAQIDPGFEEALTEAEITREIVEATEVEDEEVFTGAVEDVFVPLPRPGEVVGGPPVVEPPTFRDPPPVPGHPQELPDPPETQRDPPEIFGGEKIPSLPEIIIDIILRRPGGGGGP